jgi:transcriptional antiterminator RfaH
MAYWVAARSVFGHERLAHESVAVAGFEIFAPRTRTLVGSRWRTVPLFGNYFFVRIEERWRAIERALGVASVVRFGMEPARVPDQEIGKLFMRADPDGIIRLDPPPFIHKSIPVGAKVRVISGPLKGFEGLYLGQSARDRERVLLEVLGAKRPVELARGLAIPV